MATKEFTMASVALSQATLMTAPLQGFDHYKPVEGCQLCYRVLKSYSSFFNPNGMPQSITKNYIHILFSTKNREPLLFSPVKEELYGYFGEICKRMDCFPIRIGGYTDHVHILCLLSKKITLIKLVEAIKSYSSKWIKTKGEEFQGFYWQEGYAAFSVSHSQLASLKAYIDKQELHHQENDFKEE